MKTLNFYKIYRDVDDFLKVIILKSYYELFKFYN